MSACPAYPFAVAHPEPQDVPPLLQTLLEVIARQLGMARGRATLEVRFEDGRVRDCFRHEGPIGPGGLRRFEEISGEKTGA